ncbi:MAG: sel1 repeat family protein [Firmicutes bacterium]|nr:sel1 repeat family protein [Bacillota bacterium]
MSNAKLDYEDVLSYIRNKGLNITSDIESTVKEVCGEFAGGLSNDLASEIRLALKHRFRIQIDVTELNVSLKKIEEEKKKAFELSHENLRLAEEVDRKRDIKKDSYYQNIDSVKRGAENGDVTCQNLLGTYCELGYYGIINADVNKAIHWYKKAAEAGGRDACCHLGRIYINGKLMTINYKEAFKSYKQGAENGCGDCTSNLAICYLQGIGTAQNFADAIAMAKKASWLVEDGIPENLLGMCYLQGLGVPVDYNEALKYFKLSAEQKNSDGIANFEKLQQKKTTPIVATTAKDSDNAHITFEMLGKKFVGKKCDGTNSYIVYSSPGRMLVQFDVVAQHQIDGIYGVVMANMDLLDYAYQKQLSSNYYAFKRFQAVGTGEFGLIMQDNNSPFAKKLFAAASV